MKKIAKYAAIGLLTALVLGAMYVKFVLEPQEVLRECNNQAVQFVEERSAKQNIYPQAARNADYKFYFQACARSKGYEYQ
jgi:hypothetical protein